MSRSENVFGPNERTAARYAVTAADLAECSVRKGAICLEEAVVVADYISSLWTCVWVEGGEAEACVVPGEGS